MQPDRKFYTLSVNGNVSPPNASKRPPAPPSQTQEEQTTGLLRRPDGELVIMAPPGEEYVKLDYEHYPGVFLLIPSGFTLTQLQDLGGSMVLACIKTREQAG